MAEAESKQDKSAELTLVKLQKIIEGEDGVVELPNSSHDLVYPNIYISEESFVRNKGKMKAVGITHVLNVAEGNTFYHVNLTAEFYKDTGIAYKGIKASDSHTFSFKSFLQEICDYIGEAIQEGGTVVVNCREGVSRSSTCVIAFLMLKRNLHVTDALKTVLDNRKVCPNDNFLRELIDIEKNREKYIK